MFVKIYIKIITKFVIFTIVSVYLIFQEISFTKNIEVIRDCRKTAKERKTRNAIPII